MDTPNLFALLLEQCQAVYGDRLVSLVVFGSVARGTSGPDSDLDFLVIADDLPFGRVARVRQLDDVEKRLRATTFPNVRLSPVLKTRNEANLGSPLFLDMLEDGVILCDRDGFVESLFDRMRARLQELGARRIWRGNAWYWDLKPDYRPGEVFEL